MPGGRITATFAVFAFLILASQSAWAEQSYSVAGTDTFTFGADELRSIIDYSGSQTLAIVHKSGSTHYEARVKYSRVDQGARAAAKASFEATLLPSGEQRDDANDDPDFLTVLNQPFSVQLDQPTMQALVGLRGAVPFDFPSPMTASPLRGHLSHVADGVVGGVRSLGVGFDASGSMRGSVPEHPGMTLAGRIHMSGTAYYDYQTALLLALDATLTISGNVAGSKAHEPVTIVYKRSIRADVAPPVKEARASTAPAATIAPAGP